MAPTTLTPAIANLVNTIIVPGNATDLFQTNGGSGGANVNRLSLGSDFFYDYRSGFYYGLADRGPGGGTISFQTRVEKIALTIDPTTGAASGFQVVQTIPFYIPAGTTLNGITYTSDTPLNGLNPSALPAGSNSMLGVSFDPEGFVVGANGNFFVSDEYGPSVYEFSPTGTLVRAFTPPANLLPKKSDGTLDYVDSRPIITSGRQDNRGFEGLTISPDGTKLFAILQDPLVNEGTTGTANDGRYSPNVRIVRFDVATGQSDTQYIYQLESLSDINDRIPDTTNDFAATAQGRNIGVSSILAINNNELLVLERDNRGIGVDPTTNLPIGSKRVYKIDLTGASDVSTISLAGTSTLPANVTPVSKSLFLDIAGALQSSGQTVPEKLEGLALGPQLADGSFTLLVATDNDFSVTQNSSGTQFDVYTDGTQQPIDSAPPASGATLLPSYVYAFRTQPNALDVTPIFDFSTGNYSVTEGNTSGFSTNATVRITRRGDLDNTNTVQLKLSDGTATGSGLPAPAQSTVQGPSTGSTPYILPVASGVKVISLLTTDNTGANPDDAVPKAGGGTYGMDGIPDGLGAFDNGNGTFTVLMNHELGSTNGIVRDHGAKGAYVSKFVIDKSTLQVISGEDLIKQVYGWNATTQSVDTTAPIPLAINRFCSADLPGVTAFYNANTGLGSQARIFMNGEEGGATGYQFATVATGAEAGKAYILGKFNLSTNGSGLTGTGGWENALANPFAQDKTIVIGNNDGGTGIMNNAVAVYVGTKQSTGTEVDKAGLTNGTLKFINVAGSTAEIANATTRATNITNGTRFSLNSTASTTFSRPEDGAWNPLDPRQYFFATTDRLDQVSDGVGTQVGQTRLWRLTFDDITNPDAGGTIDLLVDGDTVNGVKVNMFDNITIDKSGHILLQEDVGGAAHNGKIWQYDIATDTLKQLAKHDSARFGDIGVAATSPFTNDEESSGIIDVQDILGPGWFLTSDQAHYTTGITPSQVEGGQLLAIFNPDTYNAAVDYNNTPITVTFNPGETFKDVQIPIAGDLTLEGNETINLSLVNPSVGTVIGTKQPNALLTIADAGLIGTPGSDMIKGGAGNDVLLGETNLPSVFSLTNRVYFLGNASPSQAESTNEEDIRSSLFDEAFYLAKNPDVAAAVASGILRSGFDHFTQFGQLERRNPNALFDEAFYLAKNPDVAAAVASGILRSGFDHFTQFGMLEGRLSSQQDIKPSLFDEGYYLYHNPDVVAAVAAGAFHSGFDHFTQFGMLEGRDPSAFYNEAFYLAKNPDIASAVTSGVFRSGFEHFIQFGQLEGRDPSAAFSNSLYLAKNPDIASAVASGVFRSGFEHFIQFGQKEGRDDNLLFNEGFYLSQNPDVASAVASGAFRSGFEHFIQFGQKEGRAPSELYSESAYLSQNPDVAAAVASGAFRSGFDHLIQFGQKEGRDSLAPVHDQLYGNAGNDILYSAAGGALMNGGEGSDRFWIADQILPRAASRIVDFQIGVDAIAITGLPGVTGISNLNITQQGADTSVSALGKDLATLVGVQASNLSSSSFLFTSEQLV
jgi:hypothetical protein